ncbi:MAG: glycosyltransferase family 4 protein [bacterium]|nr:glycosyltransferase family 4 protein [bacterium]
MNSQSPKILFVCTEDWFFYSHFLPLVKAAKKIEGSRIYLATTTSGKHVEIERLGVKIIPIDFDRASMRFLSAGRVSWRLYRLFQQEKPDLIHFIALKPIVIGGLAAARIALKSAAAYHLTGQGLFTVSKEARHQKLTSVFLRLLTWYLRRPDSWLFLENPDDGEMLGRYGKVPEHRLSILGGAGVDAEHFSAQPVSQNDSPGSQAVRLAFVGRLVWSKGVDILIEAMDLLRADGLSVELDLYGEPDTDNPRSLTRTQLESWSERAEVNWHGRSEDIVEVWHRADIAVVPSRGGEGMPRAMLEAASCARPVIVTDVPGCRHFVRDGEEGIIVPPEDARALAVAIARLAKDEGLRLEMGNKARQRVLEGYTERHVVTAVADIYKKLLKK